MFDRFLSILIVAVILLIAFMVIFDLSARGHSFYYIGCCGDHDCKPVPCEEIIYRNGRYGYQGIWTRPSAELQWSIFPSPDGHCHVCVGQWRDDLAPFLRCLYLPKFIS